MCELTVPIKDKKEVTGYKVVAQHKETGKYYSSATGIEYIPGETVAFPIAPFRINAGWKDGFDTMDNLELYIKDSYKGYTSVFHSILSANILLSYLHIRHTNKLYVLKVVKMTISDDLKEGFWNVVADSERNLIYAGKRVVSIQELTEKEV